MPDRWGFELEKGDLASWQSPTADSTGDQDLASLVRVVGDFGDRYVVEFLADDESSEVEYPNGLQSIVERSARLFEEINTALEEAGIGAGSLPLGSPFVVPGSELELIHDPLEEGGADDHP